MAMPQSLTIDGLQPGGSSKRQRSTDSRDSHTQLNLVRQSISAAGRLRSNVRVPAYLDKTKSEISSTFQDLEWKQRFRLFHALQNPQSSPFRVDRSDIVISRNRYGNVQPWDQSRIKLKTPIGGSDYVNASPITLKRATKTSNDGNESSLPFTESKYIATQGPKNDQLSHFWYMVHQETTGNQGVIVMLTQCYEANKEKCAIYFPTSLENPKLVLHHDDDDEHNNSNDGSLGDVTDTSISDDLALGSVTLVSASHDENTGCDVRVLDVSIANTTKRIHHFLFQGWPDFGKPEAEDRIALLNLTRKSHKLAQGSPRIVHCSAGVGRTGTFIALDFLIREIEEGRFVDSSLYPSVRSPAQASHLDHPSHQGSQNETWGKSGPPKVRTPTLENGPSFEDADSQSYRDDLIYSTVNTLREQRMMMVMNEVQYALLYEIVREVFWDTHSTRPEGATIKKLAIDSEVDRRPRNKVVKIGLGGEGEGRGGDSGSEAETEIMEDKTDGFSEASSDDPYAVIAPRHVLEGIKKEL